MTINQLLDNIRKEAVITTYNYYVEICDGEHVEEEIKADKETGEYYKDLERFTLKGIYKLIKNIRKTNLMTDEEKEKAIDIIHKCPEYIKTEKNVSNILIDHFKRNIELYKTM